MKFVTHCLPLIACLPAALFTPDANAEPGTWQRCDRCDAATVEHLARVWASDGTYTVVYDPTIAALGPLAISATIDHHVPHPLLMERYPAKVGPLNAHLIARHWSLNHAP